MKKFYRPLYCLWVVMVAMVLILAESQPVKAMPPDPPDTDPIGEVPVGHPDNGFYWSVPDRFGNDANGDGLIDFHWIQDGKYDPNGYYDPAYVHPSEYIVNFDGCWSDGEYWTGISENTYHWRFLNPGEAEDAPGEVIQGNACRISKAFPAQDTYRVRLTIRRPDGSVVLDDQGRGDPFRQDVVVKDILIVSIGDSYASGEGNPDIAGSLAYNPYPLPGQWWVTRQPRWQDARCGRSIWGGPAQAAMAIERSDSRTSVTFLSFACSGATIDTPFWKDSDLNKYLGVGILQPYRGSETPEGYSYDVSTFIPSQIDQVRAAIDNRRTIDAMIISGGGNDIRFGTVAEKCVTTANCWINAYAQEHPNGTNVRLDALVGRAVSLLPEKFARLAAELDTFDVANIFITEYPDPSRSNTPNAPNELDRYCGLVYDIIPGFEISPAETKTAIELALNPLNQAVADAAAAHGWNLVDGIADQFRMGPNGKGHGYCASEAWIRSASDAFFMQGPFWGSIYGAPLILEKSITKGTMHPTARGHQVYAQRLVETMLPRLNPSQPTTPPPAFTSSLTSDTYTSRQGENGWLTGRCEGTTCTSDQAVLKVEAAAQGAGTVLRGTKVSINGVEGCSGVAGIACTAQTAADLTAHAWTFNISQNGVYRLQFQAKDSNLQVSTFAYEVQVDLDDPTASAEIAGDTPNNAGWFTAPVPITFSGTDPSGLSGVARLEYSLDGEPGQIVVGETLTVANDGAHNLTYQSIDYAGRRSPQQTLSFQIDQTAPAVSCGAADGLWHAGDVTISCSASDNGAGFAGGAETSFTLTTSVTDGTETDDAATNGQDVCDLAGNCASVSPVTGNKVDKKAPEITLNTPADTAYLLNETVTSSYDCADGGSGLASCGGPVANGSPIDTATVGVKSFQVIATDQAGNSAEQTASYRVGYNVCLLYDPSKSYKKGSTVPIRVQLCDAGNANQSSADLDLKAVGLTKVDNTASSDVADAGNSNPDNNFRYDAGLPGYVYNLSTRSLSTGTWALHFTVTGDPLTHTIYFDLR